MRLHFERYKIFKREIFFFNTGYYTTSTQDYDIKWTMPQCVLTLRLIGLAFNLWDGNKHDVRTLYFFRIILLSHGVIPRRVTQSMKRIV